MRHRKPISRLLLTCMMAGAIHLAAQTPQADITAMNKVFAAATSYDVSLDMKVYLDKADAKPWYACTGQACHSGQDYFVSMMDRITLVTARCVLVVDKRQHLILYRAIDKATPPPVSPAGMNLDSLVAAQYQQVAYVAGTAGQKVIEIKTPGEEIETIRVTIDPKTNLLKQMAYAYAPDKETGKRAKAVITYNSVRLNGRVSPGLFDESAYVSRQGKKVSPAGIYKSYKLINQNEIVTP